MKFTIKTIESPLRLGRLLGYRLLGEQSGEYNFARSIDGRHYPRFHLYVKAQRGELAFNLHLDQKQPSYKGHTAHSGEYEGELVEREAERIQKIMKREA